MATLLPGFRRLVLGLQFGALPNNMALAADFAERLGLDLLGLFVEGAGLRELAALPFARELRPLGGGWHPLDLERLSHDLECAARGLERNFLTTAVPRVAGARFEVLRGLPDRGMEAFSTASDIVMLAEPAAPGDHVGGRFSWLLDAACRSSAAVLLVPSRACRRQGPVVALAAAQDTACLETAAAIARAMGERLVTADRDAPATVAIHRIAAAIESLEPPPLGTTTIGAPGERLIVTPRSQSDSAFVSAIAQARRVPVLAI